MNMPSDGAAEATEQAQTEQTERADGIAHGDQDAAAPSAPVSTSPGPPPPSAPILPTQSREDTDVGWGDYAERDDNDRLLRDRPPHWDNG
jgi:hypothetical protein